METQNKKSRAQIIKQTIGLLLLLVVLPGGSWIYLRNGLDYRIEALEELKDYGKVPAGLVLPTQASDEPLTSEYLRGTVTVSSYLPETPEGQQRLVEVYTKLHEQFDEHDDVLLLTYTQSDSTQDLKARAQALGLIDGEQWRLVQLPAETSAADYFQANYALPAELAAGMATHPYVVLVDTSLTVRHFYDGAENKDMGRLVEHIALILPRKPEKDIIFQREQEK